jgi:hypothetical protein
MPSARTPDPSADAPVDPLPVTPPATTGAFGGLRLIEVPGDWPPYDCEIHGAACSVAHEGTVTGPWVGPDPDTAGAAGHAGPPVEFSDGADPANVWSRQFAQVITEILAGTRSPRQLTPWTTERVRARIGQLSETLSPGQKPRIRRIVTSRPAPHAVEMTVVLSFGPQNRALALRLEHRPARGPAPGLPGRPARWLCTEIETG